MRPPISSHLRLVIAPPPDMTVFPSLTVFTVTPMAPPDIGAKQPTRSGIADSLVRASTTAVGYAPGEMSPDRDAILTALERVIDPELRRPVTELEMVRDVVVADDGTVDGHRADRRRCRCATRSRSRCSSTSAPSMA